MEISDAEWQRLHDLRARLFSAIEASLRDDGHCKSYEGAFSVMARLPNYFDAKERGDTLDWNLHLDCYLIGPHRHYDWSGTTFAECLSKAEKDVDAWIAGDDESRHFEGA